MRPLRSVLSLVPLLVALAACQPAVVGDGASTEDAAADDAALTGLGKELHDFLDQFSATSGSTAYKTPEAAIGKIETLVHAAGIEDANSVVFYVQVGKTPIPVAHWDHSELLISGGVSLVDGREVTLALRAVGDRYGAGVYDGSFSTPFGPKLCMPWNMLQDLIRASYLQGGYLRKFVCHNVVSRVLRALDMHPGIYGAEIGGWDLAMAVFEPPVRLSQPPRNPDDWDAVKLCKALPDVLAWAQQP